MLVAGGLVRATTQDGTEYTFRPSFERIAGIGSPTEIVSTFVALYESERAAEEARYVLAALCDQEDVTPLVGWFDGAWHPGEMPESEQIIIARHLMQHGIVGTAKPGDGEGKYSDSFDASQYIASARVHLELSAAEAAALSMTEFQQLMSMKYPEQSKSRDVPSREEYDALMQRMEALHV